MTTGFVQLNNIVQKFTPELATELGNTHFDTVVIGSGMGGLTAAGLEASLGRRVLVLESHYTPGGHTQTFPRKGDEFPTGVHYLGELRNPATPFSRLTKLLSGGELRWTHMTEAYDRFKIGDRPEFAFHAGLARLQADLKKAFPEEEGFDSYFSEMKKAHAISGLYFALAALPAGLTNFLRSFLEKSFLYYANLTPQDVLDRHFKNPEVKALLAGQWGDAGLPPDRLSLLPHTMVAHHYFEGASFPEGGSWRIAKTFIDRLNANKGRVVVKAPVAEILVSEDQRRSTGVRLQDGTIIRADKIISNAGARNTFNNLVQTPSQDLDRIRDGLSQLDDSPAHMSLYLSVKWDGPAPALPQGNLWIYPQGDDHAAAVRAYEAAAKPGQTPAENPPPALFVSSSSARDAEFQRKHPDKHFIEVVVPVSAEIAKAWEHLDPKDRKKDPTYRDFKKSWEEYMLAVVHSHLPQISTGTVRVSEVSTPLSTRNFVRSSLRGEIYGLATDSKRYNNLEILGPRTPLENLFLVGADSLNPGVGGAAMSALIGTLASVGWVDKFRILWKLLRT